MAAYSAVDISTMSYNYMGVVGVGLSAWESGINIANAKDKAAMAKKDSESYQESNHANAIAALGKAKFYQTITALAEEKKKIVVQTGQYRMACLMQASNLIQCAMQPGVDAETRKGYFDAAAQFRENAKTAMNIGTAVEIPAEQAQVLGLGGEIPQ